MKNTIILIASCAFAVAAFAKGGGHSSGGHTTTTHTTSTTTHTNSSSHDVRGHTTKNGTYVAPSHATNPNDTKTDNFSNKGNVNPYTGKEGTKE